MIFGKNKIKLRRFFYYYAINKKRGSFVILPFKDRIVFCVILSYLYVFRVLFFLLFILLS